METQTRLSQAQLTERLQDSPVSRMFHERSIFITGASGFIGRVLLEKLLRTYPTIKTIYLLMRTKRNQLPADRLHKQLLKAPIFDKIRAMDTCDQLLAKLVVVPGDIALPNLGISDQDMQMMLDDPSLGIVFHSAATIKFDEPLKVSVTLNLIATRTIIEICKKLPNLVSLCHVSTAYVNSDIKDDQPIEEKQYPMRDDYRDLIKMAETMTEDEMQVHKARLVDQRPNTYTYTKALTEQLVRAEAGNLPVAIVRPSIVVASWRDPMPGWIDNMNGPTGIILAVGNGLLRTMHANRKAKADLVPVDVVVNCMIASAFYVSKKDGQAKLPVARDPPIFHCNSGDIKPVTWGDLEDDLFPVIKEYPSVQVLRYPFGTFKSNRYHDLITRFFVHFLPALIIDLLCGLTGKKRQMLSIYRKVHSAIQALEHFCITNYNFKSKNIISLKESLGETDRRELFMELKEFEWRDFWHSYVLGAR